ncbi:response regulator transcription factor [Leptolyngbya ohadii]|uniref:response regulator transcription factor n=1 Tax=Leptolyngbya ohadii TaxID=1962290 RepID=UPI000B5A1FB6|nr:response regulator [Leptolyngbya ohadii]
MTTVLLVEDSLTETELLTQYLIQAGIFVVSATNCEEARVLLRSQKPDLVLLDVMLPGESGFELCRELKIHTSTSCIPVVLCSTKGTNVDKLWGSMLGANAYLPKPVQQDELADTVLRLTAS